MGKSPKLGEVPVCGAVNELKSKQDVPHFPDELLRRIPEFAFR